MSSVDGLGDALREQFPAPDGVPVTGPMGALRVTDRVLLTAHRHTLNSGGDEAEKAWLDQLLARQPEISDEAFSAAFQQAQVLGFVDTHGPTTALGKVQIASLYSRFRP